MKRLMLMAVAILFCAATVFAANPHNGSMNADTAKAKVKIAKVVYTCPMHTDVVAYKPGKCPKARMWHDAGEKDRSEKERQN